MNVKFLMSSSDRGVRPGAFVNVCTHFSLLLELVLGQESTVFIKLGGQFAGHLESTVDFNQTSISRLSFRVEAGLVTMVPWVSVVRIKKTQLQVMIEPTFKETQCRTRGYRLRVFYSLVRGLRLS